ncbi:MAG: hypothetical protein IMW89_07585 [Ktedonobacteraceae bacterium]|nr:hypothetical protein [Ktedonobacteraceae bacterium]
MNCHVCSTPLPEGAAFCPHCGTNFYVPGSASHDPTARASYVAPPQQPPPSAQFPHTGYSSSPYEVPPSGGYNLNPDPYNAPSMPGIYSSDPYTPLPRTPLATPIPQPQSRKSPLIISIVILAVAVVLGGSLFAIAGIINMNKTQQQQASATATAVANQTATVVAATQNPYPPKTGSLVISDPMHDNSRGYKWDEATMRGNTPEQGNAICGFQNNTYHMEREKKGALICNPEASTLTFKNLALEAKLTILQGNGTGLIVRFDQAKATGYLFEIFVNGDYNLYKIYFSQQPLAKAQGLAPHPKVGTRGRLTATRKPGIYRSWQDKQDACL